MDFSNPDPMFGSAVFRAVSPHQGTSFTSTNNITVTVMDFDSYSRPTMLEPTDYDMDVDSPNSESYCGESDDATSIVGLQDNAASPHGSIDEESNIRPIVNDYSESNFINDRKLIYQRWAPYDVFPVDKSWTMEQKARKLLELSPCRDYSVSDIVNIDLIERPEKRVEMLIDIVCKIKVNFRWNYVKPHELCRSYTVVTNCKKEKEKKDAEGRPIPKRPMNAFMIWCQKCRSFMSHICPQLHNAIISKALGARWKQFSPEERAVYEEEKLKLMAFHQHEFPDYKYRPKKKPKKSEEKPAPTPKSKSKKKSTKPQPAPLRGINIADEARQNLDPLLKERLQVKMQVKIDPNLKKGIGKRATAIDLADLPGFKADYVSASPEGARHYRIQNQTSSVFDTPENSPHEPITPTEIETNAVYPKQGAFRFDEKISLNLDNNNSSSVMNNNSLNLDTKPDLNDLWPIIVKSEPSLEDTFAIKSEPMDAHSPANVESTNLESTNLDYQPLMWSNNNTVSNDTNVSENTVNSNNTNVSNNIIGVKIGGIPVLSAEYVDSVLENDLNEFETPDLQELVRFINNSDLMYPPEFSQSPFLSLIVDAATNQMVV